MNDRDNKVSNHTWEVVDVNYVVPIFVSKFSNHINIEQSQPLQVFLPRQVRNQMKQMFALQNKNYSYQPAAKLPPQFLQKWPWRKLYHVWESSFSALENM